MTSVPEVEATVVRAALAQGFLAPAQLREALAVREELARRGQRIDVLALLQQRYLSPEAVAALTPIYRQALSSTQTHAAPSVPVAQALTPEVLARARAAVAQPSTDVQAFMERTRLVPAVGSDVARTSDTGELAQAPPRDPTPRAASGSDVGVAFNDTAVLPASARPPSRTGSDSDVGALFPDTAALPASARRPRPPSSDELRPLDPGVKRFGRYVVEAELARGGMGVVYRALDPQLERRVALKVVQGDGFELEERDVERFLREARATARMRHPGIVSVLDSGTQGGVPFLVMDLVEGESLDALLKQRGALDPQEAAALCAQLARALDACHQEGVLHRDVKPSNVLLDSRSGRPLLTDFGLARSERDANTLTATGQAVGTPSYMAPEQAAGERERLGPATDVYGLGATLYHLMLGRPPFRGGTLDVMRRVLTDLPEPPRKLRESVPPELEAICMRCLAKEPGERFPSAGALADALEAQARAAEPRARPSAARKAAPSAGSGGAAAGRAVLAAVTLAGLVGLGLSYRARTDAQDAVAAAATPSDPAPRADRASLAALYLQELSEDPSHAAAFALLAQQPQDALPWQVAQGLYDAPLLPTGTVVTAVVLGLGDRFADADVLLGDEPDAQPLRSTLRLQAGDTAGALAVLEGAGDAEPVLHARIRALCVSLDYDGALRAAAHLPAEHPLRARTVAEEGLLRLPDARDKLPLIDRMLADDDLCPCARFRLLLNRVQSMLDLDRYGAADDSLVRAEALRPGSPHVHFYRYLMRLEQQDFAGAALALDATRAVERVPVERARAGWFLAEAWFLAGEPERGHALLRALEQDPNSASLGAHIRARTLFLAGDLERALGLAVGCFEDRSQPGTVRAMSLEVVVEVLRAQERWRELKGLVERISEAGERLPSGVYPLLDKAHMDARVALGEE